MNKLREHAIRLEHESQYWSGYDPKLLAAVVESSKSADEEIASLKKRINTLQEEKQESSAKSLFKWMRNLVVATVVSAFLYFTITITASLVTDNQAKREVVYQEILEEIGNEGISTEYLLKSGYKPFSVETTEDGFQREIQGFVKVVE